MPLKTEETRIVTIGERSIPVEGLSEKAQQLVAFYDDWKQRELEARSNLMAIQTAMQSMGHQIAAAVAEAEAAEQEDAENDGQENTNA